MAKRKKLDPNLVNPVDLMDMTTELLNLRFRKAFWNAIEMNARENKMPIGEYLSMWIDEQMSEKLIKSVEEGPDSKFKEAMHRAQNDLSHELH